MVKPKPHINGKQAYCRHTTPWQVMINELADFVADVFSNHFGDAKADEAKLYASQALLRSVCKRIAAIEASLWEFSTDAPLVAADIITTCEAIGERRRTQVR